MSIGLGQSVLAAVSPLQEWQQLCWTATSQAIGCYLQGCADLAMARTPRHAMAALHKTQSGLLKHSADTVAEVTRLWRKQNTEPRAEYEVRSRAPAPSARSAKG